MWRDSRSGLGSFLDGSLVRDEASRRQEEQLATAKVGRALGLSSHCACATKRSEPLGSRPSRTNRSETVTWVTAAATASVKCFTAANASQITCGWGTSSARRKSPNWHGSMACLRNWDKTNRSMRFVFGTSDAAAIRRSRLVQTAEAMYQDIRASGFRTSCFTHTRKR